jgi:transcriptional regulator with XRE-family HTH domain
MEDLKKVIAKNIIELRRSMNMTQAELAQKLNYSDKAVSKWERGESIPDVIIIKRIADLFGVPVDYLMVSEHTPKEKLNLMSIIKKRNHLIIAMLSTALVFLIATFVFVLMGIYFVNITKTLWLVYIYAIPAASIVLLVFNSLWGKPHRNYVIISVLVWSVLASVFLTCLAFSAGKNLWLIFLLGIPAQIIIVLWAHLRFWRK